jgi:hypothetical protein
VRVEPTPLETQLYLSLRAKPCSCEFERTAGGVPIWFVNSENGALERKLIKQCSRCAGVEEYERLWGPQ